MEYALCLLRRHQNPSSRPSSPWPISGITCLLHLNLFPNLLLIFSLSLISPKWYSLAINHNKKLSPKSEEWSTQMLRNINVLRPFPFCPSPLYPGSVLTSTRPFVVVMVFCNNFSSNLFLKINFLRSQGNPHKFWLVLCSMSNPNQKRPNPNVTIWGLIRWFLLMPWRSRSAFGWKRSLFQRPALLMSGEERALECCWPLRGKGYDFEFLWCCLLVVVKNIVRVPSSVLLRPLRRRDGSSSGAWLVARKAFAGGASVSRLLLEVWSSWRPTKFLSKQVPLKTRCLDSPFSLIWIKAFERLILWRGFSHIKVCIALISYTLTSYRYNQLKYLCFKIKKTLSSSECCDICVLSKAEMKIKQKSCKTWYDMKQNTDRKKEEHENLSKNNEPILSKVEETKFYGSPCSKNNWNVNRSRLNNDLNSLHVSIIPESMNLVEPNLRSFKKHGAEFFMCSVHLNCYKINLIICLWLFNLLECLLWGFPPFNNNEHKPSLIHETKTLNAFLCFLFDLGWKIDAFGLIVNPSGFFIEQSDHMICLFLCRRLNLLIHGNHSQEHFRARTSQRQQQFMVPGITLATLPYFFNFVFFEPQFMVPGRVYAGAMSPMFSLPDTTILPKRKSESLIRLFRSKFLLFLSEMRKFIEDPCCFILKQFF